MICELLIGALALHAPAPDTIWRGHKGPVHALAVSRRGDLVATGGYDHDVRIWDATTGRTLRVLRGHTQEVDAVAFSPSGALLASASFDGGVHVWDVASGRIVRILHPIAWSIAVAFANDSTLVVGDQAKQVTVHALRSSTITRTIAPGFEIYSLAAAPDGQSIVVAPRHWYDLGTGALQQLRGHTGRVYSIAFSADGKRLATASWNGTAIIFDAATRVAVATLSAPRTVRVQGATGPTQQQVRDPLTSVAFSPDAKLAVTGGADTRVRVWNADTGAQLQELKGHTMSVTGVAFLDATHVISCSLDGTVRVWQIEPK